MKSILLATALLAAPTWAATLGDQTYTAVSSVGATQYFLEGPLGGATATWTINPGVTVTGGRYFIGSSATPNDALAKMVIQGGGTLVIDRIGTYNLRLGQDNTSEPGALVISGGSTVAITGTTAGEGIQKAGGYIELNGHGSAFSFVAATSGTRSFILDPNGTSGSFASQIGSIPFRSVGGVMSVSTANGVTTIRVGEPPPVMAAVNITPANHLLRPGDTVTLSSTPGSEIRYTLDGSDPNAGSPIYQMPISLAAPATVKARTSSGANLGEVASATFAVVPAAPPNVLVILADDVGFNDLGCYGAVSVITPRLDALAWQGQRFTQATTTGPGESASPYALVTGRLAARSGLAPDLVGNAPGIDTREWTLAEALRKAGYRTGFVGKWKLGGQAGNRPQDQGFASVTTEGATLGPYIAAGTEFLSAQDSQPFFLMFAPPSLPAAGNSLLGDYGNRIEALDSAVGSLLDALQLSGKANDTLVLFVSDSGADRNTGTFPTGSNGQLRDGKGTTWEGGVRVPMLARWPGVIPAGDNFVVVWLPDLFTTLTDVAQAWTPGDRVIDGNHRADALLGARTRPDSTSAVYLHRHTGSGYQLQSVRLGPWKLHLSYTNSDPENTVSTAAPLLYHLEQDPTERIQRAGEQATVLATLQQLATNHQADLADPSSQLPAARPPFVGKVSQTTVSGDGTATRARFQFNRPADSINDHYLVERSVDLLDWATLEPLSVDPFVTASELQDDGNESVTIEIPFNAPVFTGPKHFIRLKGTRP